METPRPFNPDEVLAQARRTLSVEVEATRTLIDRIGDSFLEAVRLILSPGVRRVIFTGMGKSGHIGRKLAATFAGTGTPSLFLHPAEALHGDLGMVTAGDVVVAISNSGESEEVVRILPAIKALGARLIAMTGKPDSSLGRAGEVVLDIGVTQEADPLGLAPTASAIATLAMGDALACALMTARGFTAVDFLKYHPGGSLGKQLSGGGSASPAASSTPAAGPASPAPGHRSPQIVVVGSFMMDLVARTDKVPVEGETVFGTGFSRCPGGKGANQAVAAARLGAHVTMVGKVGKDLFGDDMLNSIQKDGVDVQFVGRAEALSGVGHIVLDAQGRNRIIVIPGANMEMTVDDVRRAEDAFRRAEIVMLQLEIPDAVVAQTVSLAKKCGARVILNPAPARPIAPEVLAQVDILTPNETEAEILTGIAVRDLASARVAANKLLAQGVQMAVVTLGEKGAYVAGAGVERHVPGRKVTPVDTVAAGDAFNGALAAALAAGASIERALDFANGVAAISVTRSGAQPSMPTYREVVQTWGELLAV